MIFGAGTDIIEVARVKKSVSEISGFKKKIFSAAEIEYCESKARKFEHYAGRFAVKEAFLKAIGTGWRYGIAFNEIEVKNDGLGKPELNLSGKALEFVMKNRLVVTGVSLSHTKDNAVAFVIIEKKEG